MKKEKDKNSGRPYKIWYTGGLNKEKKSFLENLSVMVNAGLDILGALEAVKEDTRSRRMRRIVANLIFQIDNGEPLWRAMSIEEVFPNRFVSLIKIGEESGKLSENLLLISDQLEKEQTFGSKIRTAMLYPSVVLPFTVVVGLGTAWYTLPRLTEVFKQMNIPLPFLTRMLIAAGDFIRVYGSYVIPIFLIFFISILYFLFSFPKTKSVGMILISRMPVISKLVQQVELARLGYILGNMLIAGIPIVESFRSLEGATVFNNYRKVYTRMREAVESGESLRNCFQNDKKISRFIPRYVQQMIGAAEQSGKLAETLYKIGRGYELKLESSIKDFSTILEPAMLIVIGLVVGLVAFAIITPIYSMVQVF